MSTTRRHDAVRLLGIPALIMASACSDQATAPTVASAVSAPTRPHFARKPEEVVTIQSLTINPTNLTIGGGSVAGTPATWTATIVTPKGKGLSNVYYQTRFVVYNVPSGTINSWRGAGGGLIQCPGRSFGFLPSGNCTISGTATPTNNATGGGTLAPDDLTKDAKFELEILQNIGQPTLKLIAKRATDVTLFYQFQ